MIRTRKNILCAFIFLSSCNFAAASTCPADDYIQSAGQAFMSASRRGTGAAFSTAASRYADLHGLALFALGNFRKFLPKSRETEYVARTRTYMGNFMAEYGSKFAGDSIAITSCNEAAGGLTVGTKLSTGQVIIFRLQKSGGSYRVKDVSVSAIWLAQIMRNKFTRIIKENNGDVEALISYLGK